LAWRLQYNNEDVTKLVDQAAGMQNTPQRATLYKRVNDAVVQDGPFVILYQPFLSLTVSKRLQHMVFDPVNFIDFMVLTKQ
jgi:peptide/nickel transport system substrate-binding protein